MKRLNYSISDTRPLDMVIIEKLTGAVKDYKDAWIDCKNAESGKIPRQISSPNFYHDIRKRQQERLDIILDELDDLGSMNTVPRRLHLHCIDTFMTKVNDPLYYLLRRHSCIQDFDNSLYVLDQLDHFLNMSEVNNRNESFNEVRKIFDKVSV